jgi:hypothetical protein
MTCHFLAHQERLYWKPVRMVDVVIVISKCIVFSSSERKDLHEFKDLTSDMESKNGDVMCFSKFVGWVMVECSQRGESALSNCIGFPSSRRELPAVVCKRISTRYEFSSGQRH